MDNVVRHPRFSRTPEELEREKRAMENLTRLQEAATALECNRAIIREHANNIARVIGTKSAARVLRQEADRIEATIIPGDEA